MHTIEIANIRANLIAYGKLFILVCFQASKEFFAFSRHLYCYFIVFIWKNEGGGDGVSSKIKLPGENKNTHYKFLLLYTTHKNCTQMCTFLWSSVRDPVFYYQWQKNTWKDTDVNLEWGEKVIELDKAFVRKECSSLFLLNSPVIL